MVDVSVRVCVMDGWCFVLVDVCEVCEMVDVCEMVWKVDVCVFE